MHRLLRPVAYLVAVTLLIFSVQPAPAQTNGSQEARQAELAAAWKAGSEAGQAGPADVKLRDQGKLKLPQDYFFVPATEGLRIMRAFGNLPNESTFTGLIVGTKAGDDWMIVVDFIKEGYIKDDDAKDWNADDLLKSVQQGTAEANKNRVARGFPEIEIVGWVEKPNYNAKTHHLLWSMSSKQMGAPSNAALGVNYNTFALGREGYFSFNLLTALARIEDEKSIPQTVLANMTYDEGKRYADFNPATDNVAEYGLAALVGVAAAKKLGFFALILAFLAKFANFAILAFAAIGVLVFKVFGSKKLTPETEADPPPPPATKA